MQCDRRLAWWSWADIIERADQLGIPHFQRGAIWGMPNRTALLESMYEQSPCGSFVLWQPRDGGDPRRHGVPLHSFGQNVTPMWLVDGQQRTRAMLDTYLQLLVVPTVGNWSLVCNEEISSFRSLALIGLTDAAVEEDESEDDARFWGVVLPAMRQFDEGNGSYFAGKSQSRGVRRGPVFRRHSPSARTQHDSEGREKAIPPRVLGLVPLTTLVAPAGIFHDGERRRVTAQALESLRTDQPDIEGLDKILPWGPQFVTGHAYEKVEDGIPIPMGWADVHRRTSDADVAFMVNQLAGLFSRRWVSVFRHFRDMFAQGRFAVGWLPPSDVSAAIDAYVRINRAGIRVRQEEQALALLSRPFPHLLDELAEFIRLRDGQTSAEDGRSLLVHESDRQMGFTVWMRAVTRYSALALLGTSACNWLGTSAIGKDTFSYRLGRVGCNETKAGMKTWAREDYSNPGELVRECSARATRTLALVDSLLSEELWLDHRMARPSTWGLTPIVDLFYRVPESLFGPLERDSDFRAAVARLLHWTLLAPYLDQTDLRRLIGDIQDVPDISVERPIPPWSVRDEQWRHRLREAIARYQTSLLSLWRRRASTSAERQGSQPFSVTDLARSQALTELALHSFKAGVHEARSLQHPAVGWLYAIERRGGAREFLWQAQYDGHREQGDKVGIPEPFAPYRREAGLSRPIGKDAQQLYPEKQHVVPFDYARRIVGKGGTRSTASPANAIGNLTWLSQRQNGLGGFSNRWTVMDIEHDGRNLDARGMLSRSHLDENSRTALDLYVELCDAVLNERKVDAEQLFYSFCEIRSDWMVRQMREWLEQPMTDAAAWWLGAEA